MEGVKAYLWIDWWLKVLLVDLRKKETECENRGEEESIYASGDSACGKTIYMISPKYRLSIGTITLTSADWNCRLSDSCTAVFEK